MYLVKTPKLIQALMPTLTWKLPTPEPVLYLTFDDGPIPEVTPWVLETLDAYDARATFFCVGHNVEKYPELFQKLLNEGHSVGNHTFSHLNGWESENIPYFNNVRRCAQLVKSPLFRPPYGRISPSQRQFLLRHYQIVMWDVLSGDFDQDLSPEQCLKNVVDSAGRGSVVVLHDSIKAEPRLRYALPLILEHFSKRGYRFEAIPMINTPVPKFELETSSTLVS